ncbi:hypothetical protein LXL04_023477 [Taraxacum kok-saghyz]
MGDPRFKPRKSEYTIQQDLSLVSNKVFELLYLEISKVINDIPSNFDRCKLEIRAGMEGRFGRCALAMERKNEETKMMGSKEGDAETERSMWCSNDSLAVIFPRVFALELKKDSKVGERLGVNPMLWQRRREPRFQLNRIEDRLTLCEVFSTSWMRDQISKSKHQNSVSTNRWLKWIPKKTNIFIWRLLNGRIPVMTVLQDLGAVIPNKRCQWCDLEDESVNCWIWCVQDLNLLYWAYWKLFRNKPSWKLFKK